MCDGTFDGGKKKRKFSRIVQCPTANWFKPFKVAVDLNENAKEIQICVAPWVHLSGVWLEVEQPTRVGVIIYSQPLQIIFSWIIEHLALLIAAKPFRRTQKKYIQWHRTGSGRASLIKNAIIKSIEFLLRVRL